MPEISVILCSYNRAEKVAACLRALKKQSIPQERFEVICVNDGSTDETGRAMIDGLAGLNGLYLEHSENRALAAARNTGIRAASGEIIILINDDTYPEPEFLFEHFFAHRKHSNSNVAILGYIPFSDELRERFFSVLLMDHNLYFPFEGMEEGEAYSFAHFVGGNISLRRDAFIENDLWFDESFGCYGYEDTECGYRLAKLGYHVIYHPRARVVHDHKVTLAEYRSRADKNATNILQTLCLHPELRYSILGVERVDQNVVDSWSEEAERLKPEIECLAAEIEFLQDRPIGKNPAEAELEQQTLESAAKAIKAIREFHEKQSFARELNENPSLFAQLSR